MENTNTPRIELTKEKFTDLLYLSLCDGLHYFSSYGLTIDYNDEDYAKAKRCFNVENDNLGICWEDVLIKMLELKLPISIIDEETGEYNVALDIDELYSNVHLVPLHNLVNIIDENYDAEDCDAFLQSVFFKEIVFC
jgi:hypothetical protein